MADGDQENTNEAETVSSSGPPHTRHICRFYSQGRYCHFGKRCRFVHQRTDSPLNANTTDQETEPEDSQKDSVPHHQQDRSGNTGKKMDNRPKPPPVDRPVTREPNRRPCRYFLSGFCAMEDRCRFWHPPTMLVEYQFAPKTENHPTKTENHPTKTENHPTKTTPAPHVNRPQEVKLSDLTENATKELRDTEIQQMIKRFPKHQLIIQERGDGQVTYYRATVEATDPDWPFDLKEVVILVSFPEEYPLEIFTLDLPLDQDLPSVMGSHVQQASLEWLQAKHATNELMGKVELLFRPYLRWLDRSMERLFTEGARQVRTVV